MVVASGYQQDNHVPGRWGERHVKAYKSLHCSPQFAEQVARSLCAELKSYAQQVGAVTTEGGKVVTNAGLTTFHFAYRYGADHDGIVKLSVERNDSMVHWSRPPPRPEDIPPNSRPPFFQLSWEIDEFAGPGR